MQLFSYIKTHAGEGDGHGAAARVRSWAKNTILKNVFFFNNNGYSVFSPYGRGLK